MRCFLAVFLLCAPLLAWDKSGHSTYAIAAYRQLSPLVRAKVDAVLVLGSGLWVPGRRKIIDLALKARLPTVFHQFDWVGAGGLVSYGFNFPTLWRRGAEIATSILRGVKPSEIPMEQPTTYELAINLKTAKALGIKIPDIVMVRATRVIE